MHDLMVTISLLFLLAAVISLLRGLYVNREISFLIAGIVSLVVLVASAMIYYTGLFVSVLPWEQRLSFGLLTIWLMSLDWVFPRQRSRLNRLEAHEFCPKL